MAVTYEPIQTYTATSNVSVINFSSIPATYDDLILVGNLIAVGNGTDSYMRFNGSTTGYYRQGYFANGSTIAGNRSLNSASIQMAFAVVGINAGFTGQMISHIAGYSSTNYATSVITRGNQANHTTPGNYEIGIMSQIWNNTSVVNQIQIAGDSSFSTAAIATGSVYTLFGIKGA